MHDIPGLIWFLAGLSVWPLWKLLHPFRCDSDTCGFRTWSAERMLNHVESRHVHRRRKKVRL